MVIDAWFMLFGTKRLKSCLVSQKHHRHVKQDTHRCPHALNHGLGRLCTSTHRMHVIARGPARQQTHEFGGAWVRRLGCELIFSNNLHDFLRNPHTFSWPYPELLDMHGCWSNETKK